MQVISSPTREEINRVHAQCSWLAVGLLSPRNWRKIARKRVLLAYNATVFRVVVENKYDQGAIRLNSAEYYRIAAKISYTGIATNTSYTNLTNDQWKSYFDQDHSLEYSGLYLVFDDFRYTNKSLNASDPLPDSFFLHGTGDDPREEYTISELMTPLDWFPQHTNYRPYLDIFPRAERYTSEDFELHIVYAFARPASLQSRIQLSLHYLAIVIAANVFKLVIMATVLAMNHGHSKYIVTLGDAIASFLASPDPCTEARCLLEDETLVTRLNPSIKTPRVDVESASSTANDSALPDSSMHGWRERTLGYYALVRDEQARFTAVA
ncbi:hypothetical protein N0V86_009669 [Didymella sp. IMI 355093]|nr:hypothetical protein N0V86_009669 [Didymella sp. IMI 355093]